jgi:hypothetical protein
VSVHEIASTLDFIKAKLTGDATLMALIPGGVKRSYAPSGTVAPYAIIGYQAGHDVLTVNVTRIMSHLLFQAKIVGPAKNTVAIFQAAARLDDLLKRTSGSATGSLILSCYREQALHYDELVGEEVWMNAGGLYHHIVQQT